MKNSKFNGIDVNGCSVLAIGGAVMLASVAANLALSLWQRKKIARVEECIGCLCDVQTDQSLKLKALLSDVATDNAQDCKPKGCCDRFNCDECCEFDEFDECDECDECDSCRAKFEDGVSDGA